MPKASQKVIVFDLDETIGHFEEFGRFIDGLAALSRRRTNLNIHYKKNAFEQIIKKTF